MFHINTLAFKIRKRVDITATVVEFGDWISYYFCFILKSNFTCFGNYPKIVYYSRWRGVQRLVVTTCTVVLCLRFIKLIKRKSQTKYSKILLYRKLNVKMMKHGLMKHKVKTSRWIIYREQFIFWNIQVVCKKFNFFKLTSDLFVYYLFSTINRSSAC